MSNIQDGGAYRGTCDYAVYGPILFARIASIMAAIECGGQVHSVQSTDDRARNLRVRCPKAARVSVRSPAVLLHASHAPQGLGGRQAGCAQGGPEPGHGADENGGTHAAAPGEGRYDDEFVLGRGVDGGR